MSSVELYIPWGGTLDEQAGRAHAGEIVQAYAAECFPGWYRGLALSPLDPFTRASACNLAAERSTARVIVFLDADSIVHPAQLAEAAMRAGEQGGAHRAYSVYHRLTEQASARVERWQNVLHGELAWSQEATASHGAWAVERKTFVEIGGYDPRFVYFYDDLSFDIRAQEIPQSRVDGPLYHLWHPPREAPEADETLWRRYEHEDPTEVRAEAGWPL